MVNQKNIKLLINLYIFIYIKPIGKTQGYVKN